MLNYKLKQKGVKKMETLTEVKIDGEIIDYIINNFLHKRGGNWELRTNFHYQFVLTGAYSKDEAIAEVKLMKIDNDILREAQREVAIDNFLN